MGFFYILRYIVYICSVIDKEILTLWTRGIRGNYFGTPYVYSVSISQF